MENSDTKEMRTGYVALLDVLGFSSLVLTDGDGERLKQYLKCLQDVLKSNTAQQTVDAVVFSDAIVLTTKDDSDDSLLLILKKCSVLFGSMLSIEIPIRGSISHGKYFRSEITGGVFVAGKAILEAHDYEKFQNWVGIMLGPSIIQKIPGLADKCKIARAMTDPDLKSLFGDQRYLWAAYLQPWDNIPFKDNSSLKETYYDGFAIVPSLPYPGMFSPRIHKENIYKSILMLQRLKSIAPDPGAQAKYKKPCEWLEDIRKVWGYIENVAVKGEI